MCGVQWCSWWPVPDEAVLCSAGKDRHFHSAVKTVEFELFRGNKILEGKTSVEISFFFILGYMIL